MHAGILLERRNKLEKLIFVFSFLTLNLEIFPGGEYQPIGFIFLIGLLAIRFGGLRRSPMRASCSLLFLALLIFLVRQINFPDLARILAICIFLGAGSLLVLLVDKSVMRVILSAHLIVLGFGLILPGLVIEVLGRFFPRGVSYYSGFNAFFSSEPSYAALNLFGVYILYRLNIKRYSTNYTAGWIDLGVVLCLMSTFSVTGIILALCVIFDYIFSSSNSRAKYVLKLAIVPVFCFIGIFYLGEILVSSERLSSFVYFLSTIDVSDFLLSWTLLEPSSSTRFISNASAVVEGVTSVIGTGTFSLLGPEFVHYPAWLRLAFDSNGIVAAGSSPQTPVAGLILFGGVFGIIFALFLLARTFSSINRFPGGSKMLFVFFLVICAFWQAAVTYPFFWVFISCLLSFKRQESGRHSTQFGQRRFIGGIIK